MEIDVSAPEADGVFADEPMQRRTVVPGLHEVQPVAVVLAADVLERISAGRARNGGVTEGIVGILRDEVATCIGQRHYAAHRVDQRHDRSRSIGALDKSAATAPDIRSHRRAAEFLNDAAAVVEKPGRTAADVPGGPATK